MKNTLTPHTHTAITAEEITTEFGASGSVMKRTITVPKGTLCNKLDGGSQPWVVSDLSFIANKHSFDYHDAEHYGIPIKEEQLIDILPKGIPRTVAPAKPVDAPQILVAVPEESEEPESDAPRP